MFVVLCMFTSITALLREVDLVGEEFDNRWLDFLCIVICCNCHCAMLCLWAVVDTCGRLLTEMLALPTRHVLLLNSGSFVDGLRVQGL